MTHPRAALFEAYRGAVGRRVAELATPALIVDLGELRENVRIMAERMRSLPAKLRPHIKVHKSPIIARMQVDAGAIGVTCATVWEGIAMLRAGIRNVLIANQVVGTDKIATLVDATRLGEVIVAVDDPGNVQQLSAAASASGRRLGVLIEVDVGMGRSGVRNSDGAVELARSIATAPGLVLRGVQGYEGHCMLQPDSEKRAGMARSAMGELTSAVDRLIAAGFPCEIVSGGGTGTYLESGGNPRVTDIQAGSYTVMDAFHSALVSGFSIALRVVASVVSRQGDTVVLDAGRKAVSSDLAMPWMIGKSAVARSFAEEHGIFTLEDRALLKVGDIVELVSGYAPTTVNLYDVYHVVEGDRVVDIWPVEARGPGHSGLFIG